MCVREVREYMRVRNAQGEKKALVFLYNNTQFRMIQIYIYIYICVCDWVRDSARARAKRIGERETNKISHTGT